MVRPSSLVESRPDNTQSIVGREGIPVRQDTDGTQIQRLGVAGADADWGPASNIDISNGGERKIANPENVGGTKASSGIIRSESSANLSVVYAWSDGGQQLDTIQDARNYADAIVEEPPAAQNVQEVIIEEIKTKSDHCDVFVVDESNGSHTFAYTLNFH